MRGRLSRVQVEVPRPSHGLLLLHGRLRRFLLTAAGDSQLDIPRLLAPLPLPRRAVVASQRFPRIVHRRAAHARPTTALLREQGRGCVPGSKREGCV